jgi:hypothetical protein
MTLRFFPKTVWGRTLFCLASLVLVLLLFALACSAVNRIRLAGTYRSMEGAYPSLVIQRVSFSKYLVAGTLPETNPHFAKLDIWLARGTADVEYDLSSFALDGKKTDYLNRVLCLRYSGTGPFEPNVDVAIAPSDIRKVESIESEKFTDDEIKKYATGAAVVTGLAGAVVGAKAASSGAGAIFGGLAGGLSGGIAKKVSSLIPVVPYSGGVASLVGAAAGGALAGGMAYCFTDDFLAAIQRVGKGDASVMDMLAAAEPLIARELGGTDAANAEYRKAFEVRVSAIARGAGWKGVIFEYGGAK